MSRPSEHHNEWVVCNPVQPDTDEAPTGLRLQALPVAITESGALVTPEPTYTYPTAASGQRDTKTTLDVSVDDGTHITRNRVASSNRTCNPVTWRTTVTQSVGGAAVTDLSWLQTGGSPGSGAAMQMSERMFERWDDDDTGLHHNPNMGGAGQTGADSGENPELLLQLYGGRGIEYSASGSTHVGCVHPVDFGGDPAILGGDGNDGQSNHDGDGVGHPLLWWQHRQYQRIDLNYQGDANVHKVTNWWYAPTEWNTSGVSGPYLHYLTATNALPVLTFNKAYIHNMATGAVVEVADFAPAEPVTELVYKNWDISKNGYILDGVSLGSSPVPEGKIAILLNDESIGFAVAFVAKLTDTDDSPGLFTATESRSPNYIDLQQYVPVGAVAGNLEGNWNTAVNFLSKTHTKRPAGWIGHQYFVACGHTDDVLAALNRIFAEGWLDDDVDEPSATAKAGTVFPNATEAAVILPTPPAVPALVGAGQSQMFAGFGQWWNLEVDPVLGKASAAYPLSDSYPVSTLDTGNIIWNDAAARFEAMSVFTNAWGSFGNGAPTAWGPNVSLSYAFKLRHGACWAIWMGFGGAGLSNSNPLLPASWNAAGIAPFIIPLSVTVTRIGDGTTATIESGIPGIFAGVVPGATIQITGSPLGYLDFQTGSNEHPLRDVDAEELGGNSTHYARGVTIIGVDGDASAITVHGGSGVIVYQFANETALLTFIYGPVSLADIGAETIERAQAHALAKLNRTLDAKLMLTFWGESEIGASREQIRSDLAAHIDWMRGAMGVDLVDPEAPHGVIELTPFTPAGTDAEVLAVINAQRDVVDLRPRIFTVNTEPYRLRMESATWPILARSQNGTHYTCSSLNRIGVAVDERYATFEDVPPLDPVDPFPGAGGDPQDPLDPYPGGGEDPLDPFPGGGGSGGGEVTFIVEDGTGLEDANSYAAVDFATTYFASYGASAEWTAANTATKQQALVVASEHIDQVYQDRFVGYQLNPGVQSLEIPRSPTFSKNGAYIEGVPEDVMRATCEVARRWLINPDDLLPDEAAASNVQTKSVAIGPLRFDKQFSGSATTSKSFPIVDKLMRKSGLLQAGGWAVR